MQQAEKKAEAKNLLEAEMASIKKVTKAAPSPKVTRAQIETNVATATAQLEKEKPPEEKTHLDEPLEENFNRFYIEGEEARSVTEAIILLKYVIIFTTKCKHHFYSRLSRSPSKKSYYTQF